MWELAGKSGSCILMSLVDQYAATCLYILAPKFYADALLLSGKYLYLSQH